MKKFYCERCSKVFRNGELFCDICGQELKQKKISPKKKFTIIGIFSFLLVVIISTYIVSTKDHIRMPKRLDEEARFVLDNEEQYIVNSFVESIIDSYNAGSKSNNYFKWSVCSGDLFDEYEKMVERFGYRAESRDELSTAISLISVSKFASEIEYSCITGTIDDREATPEEIRDYIKENINRILNNLYY